MIGGARSDLEADALEAGGEPLAKAQGRGRAERDSDDLIEYVAVAVPTDAGAGIVAGEQGVDEVVRFDAGKRRGRLANRLQPVWDRLRGRKAGVVEIVPPAEALRL